MNLTRDRARSIGWAIVLTLCAGLTVALMLRVNAVKGKVHEAENRIVSLKRDILFLEVEFQTRANQQQLASLNDIEFGYVAPGASQYIGGERQLAALGVPRGPDAPSPIRMASAVMETEAAPFMELVSPVTENGENLDSAAVSANAADLAAAVNSELETDAIGSAIASADLGERLARIELSRGADE